MRLGFLAKCWGKCYVYLGRHWCVGKLKWDCEWYWAKNSQEKTKSPQPWMMAKQIQEVMPQLL